MLHRLQVTATAQRQLFSGDCLNHLHGRIAAKKSLLKDTNNKRRLASAEKHEQWTLDWWKSALWSDASKFEIFGSKSSVFVRRSVGERIIFACAVPTVKHGGVMV